jgi:two-component system NtrC family response regulator
MKELPVLIVDDQKHIRFVLSETIAALGLKVETAADGETALAMVLERDFSLALVDLKLPEMDGLEVLRRMRGIAPSLPVVMMTADHRAEWIMEAQAHGAVDYILKPFLPHQIRKAVREHRIRGLKIEQPLVAHSEGADLTNTLKRPASSVR